jgi:hypothetical protein
VEEFGILKEFIGMMELLFKDALAHIKSNGFLIESFEIVRRVRQGCLLASFVFLIVTMIKTKVEARIVKEIELLMADQQQVIAQYANDTSLTLLEKEESVRRLIFMLETLYLSSKLVFHY